MSIVSIIVFLVLVGIGLYVLNRLPMVEGTIKTIINAVVILCVLLWLLDVFVGLGHLGYVGTPRVIR